MEEVSAKLDCGVIVGTPLFIELVEIFEKS